MPIYEYSCQACGKRFQKLQRMGADAGDTPCPACGSTNVRREISGFSSVSSNTSSGTALCGSPSPGCGSGGFT
jgi:putative FmdB family regulatory protein